MRLLGVDWGSKRIGLAVAESEHGLPSPRLNLETTGTLSKDAQLIGEAAKKEGAEAIVVGVPVQYGEGDDRMERIVRQLGDELAALGWRVEYVDESLTSVEANSAFSRAGVKVSQRRRKKDAEAACLLLQRFIDAQAH